MIEISDVKTLKDLEKVKIKLEKTFKELDISIKLGDPINNEKRYKCLLKKYEKERKIYTEIKKSQK